MCIRKKQREREMLGNVVKERGGREEGFLLPFII